MVTKYRLSFAVLTLGAIAILIASKGFCVEERIALQNQKGTLRKGDIITVILKKSITSQESIPEERVAVEVKSVKQNERAEIFGRRDILSGNKLTHQTITGVVRLGDIHKCIVSSDNVADLRIQNFTTDWNGK